MQARKSAILISCFLIYCLVLPIGCSEQPAQNFSAQSKKAPVRGVTKLNPTAGLLVTADSLISTLARKDWQALAAYVHRKSGVRFSPYAFVDATHDIVLSRQDVATLGQNNKVFQWGFYDATGKPIKLNFNDYFQRFIFNKNFRKARRGDPDQKIGSGNTRDNISEVYNGPGFKFIEFYMAGSETYAGMDWASLRLVFKREDNNWFLVGIVHDEWTS